MSYKRLRFIQSSETKAVKCDHDRIIDCHLNSLISLKEWKFVLIENSMESGIYNLKEKREAFYMENLEPYSHILLYITRVINGIIVKTTISRMDGSDIRKMDTTLQDDALGEYFKIWAEYWIPRLPDSKRSKFVMQIYLIEPFPIQLVLENRKNERSEFQRNARISKWV